MAGPEDIFGGMGGFINSFQSTLWWLGGIIIISLMVYVIYQARQGNIRIKRFMKFPVKVVVYALRQNAVRVEEDFARRVTDSITKRETYFLKSNGREIQAFSLSNIMPGECLSVFSPAVGEYWPTRVAPRQFEYEEQEVGADGKPVFLDGGAPKMEKKVGFTLDIHPIMDESIKYLWAQRQRENVRRFTQQSFLEKWAPQLIFIVVILAVVYMFQTSFSGLATSLANVGSAIGSFGDKLGATCGGAASAASTARPPF